MKLKFLVLALMLASLTIQVQAQDQTVRVICNPGVNADSIKTQYSTSPTFSSILGESPYKAVVAGKTDTCDCQVPKVEGTTYYFRCYSWNPEGVCITDIKSVTIPKTAPSGCTLMSVQLIP